MSGSDNGNGFGRGGVAVGGSDAASGSADGGQVPGPSGSRTYLVNPSEEYDLGAAHNQARGYASRKESPIPYFHQYPSQASLDSSQSGGVEAPPEDGERLTFAPPPAGAGYGHRRQPSRAYDEHGNPKRASVGIRMAGAVSRNPTFRNVSRTLRKASVRVVNIMGSENDGRVRLGDGDDEDEDGVKDVETEGAGGEATGDGGYVRPDPMPPEAQGRLRGRTLGIFGPMNSVRMAMDSLLRYP